MAGSELNSEIISEIFKANNEAPDSANRKDRNFLTDTTLLLKLKEYEKRKGGSEKTRYHIEKLKQSLLQNNPKEVFKILNGSSTEAKKIKKKATKKVNAQLHQQEDKIPIKVENDNDDVLSTRSMRLGGLGDTKSETAWKRVNLEKAK